MCVYEYVHVGVTGRDKGAESIICGRTGSAKKKKDYRGEEKNKIKSRSQFKLFSPNLQRNNCQDAGELQ